MKPINTYTIRGTITHRFTIQVETLGNDPDALDDAITAAIQSGAYDITDYVDYDADDVELIDVETHY